MSQHGLEPLDVQKTFRDHGILLIGATGFVGKVTLALLLDRYPDLKFLYVAIRPKGSLSGENRFYHDTVKSPALAEIFKKLGPEFWRNKVKVIEGDLSQPLCGISKEDVGRLKGSVDVIVNTAGLVEFSPPLDDALASNVYGIVHLVDLARQLGARLVHVSTCFVCGKRDGLVKEDEPIVGFYPHRQGPSDASFRWEEELKRCEEMIGGLRRAAEGRSGEAEVESEELSKMGGSTWLRRELVNLGMSRAKHGGWINTYTYTKALGEQIIATQKDLTYTIVRPVILGATISFPFPGWMEGLQTTAPLILMGGAGMKNWPVRKDAPLEIVPLDLVAAGILIATAALLNGRHKEVYQLGSADVNPVLLTRLVALLGAYCRKIYKNRTEGNKLVNMAKAYIETRVVTLEELKVRRAIRGRSLRLCRDVLSTANEIVTKLNLPGKDPLQRWNKSLRMFSRRLSVQEQTLEQYLPFMVYNRFIFESANIRSAYGELAGEDKARLSWNPETIDWPDYWVYKHTKGIEKWSRSEFMKTSRTARAGKEEAAVDRPARLASSSNRPAEDKSLSATSSATRD
ncbi:MAG: SDR family oxidoreductase [Acidobacteria bacterium]|nr:SDR family oxidoreductase [Acidobacteriota bacterium]